MFPTIVPMGDAQCMFSLSFMGGSVPKLVFFSPVFYIFANYFIQTILSSQTNHLSEEGGGRSCVTEAAGSFLNGSFQAFSLGVGGGERSTDGQLRIGRVKPGVK